MGKQKGIFERTEKKYQLTDNQYQAFINLVGDKMKADRFGTHTISNIYYDTEDYEVIRHSIEKPKYKEKFRIRGYGEITSDSLVFLELKKKVKGVVYKRRVSMTHKQMKRYLVNGVLPDVQPYEQQILKEIQYSIKFYNQIPRVYLAYDRTAYEGIWDPSLRITFDRNIRTRSQELDLTCGDYGNILKKPDYLMEIKVLNSYPVWLARALSELEIFPASFSKYGTIYKEFIAKGEEEVCLQAYLAV